MPIHDLGYRSWEGKKEPAWSRWAVITATGIPLSWKSRMVRRLIFVAWTPALYFGVFFFLYELYVERVAPALQEAQGQGGRIVLYGPVGEFEEWVQWLGLSEEAIEKLRSDPGQVRGEIWSLLVYQFMRAPQVVLLMVLVGMVAPGLISRDVRTRAFLLYFSRPITRAEYLLGKSAIVGFYIGIILAAPAIVLYLFAVALSPSLGVIGQTWEIPLKIVCAYLIVAAPATLLALALSSLTTEGRYAAFAWFCVWILGWIAYAIVSASLGQKAEQWRVMSLFHCFSDLQFWIFGLSDWAKPTTRSFFVVAGVVVLSLGVLYRRISAPMRI